MDYVHSEISIDDGSPIELVKFSFSGGSWFYTSSETPIVHDGNTYTPVPYNRTSFKNTGSVVNSTIDIRIPITSKIGVLFNVRAPTETISCTVFGYHRGISDFTTIWKGRIVNAQVELPWLVLTIDNVFTGLQAQGINRKTGTQCPYDIYGKLCKVNPDNFKITSIVQAINGRSITVPLATTIVANFYAGGYISYMNSISNSRDYRMIRSSEALTGVLNLSALTVGLNLNDALDVLPGCDGSISTCAGKFNNKDNFGGQPFIPLKNPFGGSSLY